MPLWMRKGLVAIIAVLTLGTVVPTSYLHNDNKSSKQDLRGQEQQNAPQERVVIESLGEIEEEPASQEKSSPSSWRKIAMTCYSKEQLSQKFAEFALSEANDQGEEKFGYSIQNKIGRTYNQVVTPKFGQAMASLSSKMDESLLRNLEVSHNPASGTGERILHFYDNRTGEEVVKFHVRRDQPPKDGYWFNFHYHTYTDGFEKHYPVETIYWGKNTPPNWAV